MDHYKLGNFIIGLRAGMGLISLIIFLKTSIVQGSIVEKLVGIVSEIGHGSYGFLGIFLTILARFKLKKA